MGSYPIHVEFLGEKSSIDRERITVLDADDASHGWPLSSPFTTVFSKMHLTKPHRLQNSRSHGSLSTKGNEKLAACRVSPKELQRHCSLESLSDNSDQYLIDLYSDSSLSDISSDEQHLCPTYSSHTNFRDKHICSKSAVDQESERLWALFWSPKEDAPPQNVPNGKNNIDSSRVYLPSLISDLEIPEYTSNIPRSNAFRFPNHGPHTQPTSRHAPAKINPPPRPPPPPPVNFQTITSTHPQHESWPIVTIPNTAPHFPFQRSRAHTVPSDSRPRRPSKLSTCMTNDYPSSENPSGSIHVHTTTRSAPSSPFYPFPAEDLMSKMQKSVFDFESDDEDEDKDELPDWLRRLNPRKGAGHKDPSAKATAEFGEKRNSKKKSKSFSHLGEVLKRSLRIRKSGNY